jgi:hypothetical protein
MTDAATARYAGFWLRAIAAFLDLMILAVALAVFVSFLAVAKGVPPVFLALHPGEQASDVVSAFGSGSIVLMLGFFCLAVGSTLRCRNVPPGKERWERRSWGYM